MDYRVGVPWACEDSELKDPSWRALYPDLAQHGGLSPAIQHLFQQISSDLTVEEESRFGKVGPGCALIRKGARNSQVTAVLTERLFLVDFRNRGLIYGGG